MKKLFLIASIMFLVVGVAGIASANLITNGDFEDGLTGWEVSPYGGVGLYSGNPGQSAGLNNGKYIYQPISQTTLNHEYTVGFDMLSGNSGGQLQVNVLKPNYDIIDTLSYSVASNWTHEEFHFTGTGDTVLLEFYEAGTGNPATYVDNVTAHAPEPATMLLLGTGLIGLAGVGRKKFFRKTT